MSDSAPLPYGRDASGRFTPGNRAGQGRPHAFAKQAAALRRAFFEEVGPEDMRALVRKLMEEATGGNLQAARLLLLWILGKPHEPLHPDGIEAMVAAEQLGITQQRLSQLEQAVTEDVITITTISNGYQPEPASAPTEAGEQLLMPQDRNARLDLAARQLAEDMRALRGELLDPGVAVEATVDAADL